MSGVFSVFIRLSKVLVGSPLNPHNHRNLVYLFYILAIFHLSLWAQAIVEAPQALSPAVYITDSNPVFNWTVVANADRYEFLIANQAETEVYMRSDTIASNNLILPSHLILEKDKVYHWRVRGVNSEGFGPWSNTQSFMIYDPSIVPTTVGPFAYIEEFQPRFEFSEITGASHYEIILSDETGAQIHNEYLNIDASGFVPADVLNANYVYHWKVRSVMMDGSKSIWSLPMGFLIVDSSGVPEALAPSALVGEEFPLFEWSPIEGAIAYNLLLLNEAETEILANVFDIQDSQVNIPDLVQDQVYHWRVRAQFINGRFSDWSNTKSFRIYDSSLVPEALQPFGYLSEPEVVASWTAIFGAEVYELEVRDQSESVILHTKYGILQTQYDLSSHMALENEMVYHWRVRSHFNDGRVSEWSAYRGFALQIEEPPLQAILALKPTKYIHHQGRRIKFKWEPLEQDNLFYYFELYSAEDRSEALFAAYSKKSNKIKTPKSLKLFSGKEYVWKVTAVNGAGEVVGSTGEIYFEKVSRRHLESKSKKFKKLKKIKKMKKAKKRRGAKKEKMGKISKSRKSWGR